MEEVDQEAERLEHVVSSALAERMAEVLGNPRLDRHGDPIPTKAPVVVGSGLKPLSALKGGQSAVVGELRSQDPALLRYIAHLGIALDVRIVIAEKAPFAGPIHLEINDDGSVKRCVVSGIVSESIFVAPKPVVG